MPQPKKILIGLKDAGQVIELTRLACEVAARGASLLFVNVIELPDTTPLDAFVPELEAAARSMFRIAGREARRHGVKSSTLVVRAHSASYALIDELSRRKMDLAVLGYHHKKTAGELIFGTTAMHLLRHAPCRLLLSIQPAPARKAGSRRRTAAKGGTPALPSPGITF
jgi:nucleotide-binding universal stress UspA family protein